MDCPFNYHGQLFLSILCDQLAFTFGWVNFFMPLSDIGCNSDTSWRLLLLRTTTLHHLVLAGRRWLLVQMIKASRCWRHLGCLGTTETSGRHSHVIITALRWRT